ncbi:MAG: hypothetical protein CV087_14300 [Candidatus Brocadia sp. WS118]|nr:MAG: hypothetical protein CV087_14300 [Candidatus Brocadia sp. WS118]
MDITLRPGRPEDTTTCGAICYEAFKAIAIQYNFPPDFSLREVAVELLSLSLCLWHSGFYTVVTEADDRIVVSNVMDERSAIAGLGLITGQG